MLAFVDFFIQVPSRTDLQVQTSIYVNLLCHKRQTNEWKMRSVERCCLSRGRWQKDVVHNSFYLYLQMRSPAYETTAVWAHRAMSLKHGALVSRGLAGSMMAENV